MLRQSSSLCMIMERYLLKTGLLFIGFGCLVACIATPVKPRDFQAAFHQPVNIVQPAAIDAMIVYGFKIEKAETFYMQGTRPRTQGRWCSPGGESVGIWLEKDANGQTLIRTHIANSLFGAACQKDWSAEILSEIRRTLKEDR